MAPIVKAIRTAAAFPLHLYQRLSPLIPSRCLYTPTCSTYGIQAIKRFGIFRGTLLLVLRVLRCTPRYPGGADPLPTKFVMRDAFRALRRKSG